MIIKLHRNGGALDLSIGGRNIESGKFYFIKDEYFVRFTDPKLMSNSEIVGSGSNKRPSFLTFKDTSSDIFWMIQYLHK